MKSVGTYVGLKVLNPSNSLLYTHCTKAGILVKKSMFDHRLHTTVIYSKKYCPLLKVNHDIIHEAIFNNYDVFTGSKGDKVLVVKLNAPSVMARHFQLMAENDATYDHSVFIPHISLTYSYSNINNFINIPPFDFPIQLGEEYKEDLNLDWVKDNG